MMIRTTDIQINSFPNVCAIISVFNVICTAFNDAVFHDYKNGKNFPWIFAFLMFTIFLWVVQTCHFH